MSTQDVHQLTRLREGRRPQALGNSGKPPQLLYQVGAGPAPSAQKCSPEGGGLRHSTLACPTPTIPNQR